MAETVTCPECEEEVDPRGLSGHMETHDSGPQAVAGGGSEANQGGAVTVPKDDLDVPDEEMKRELLEELKEYIRGGTLRM